MGWTNSVRGCDCTVRAVLSTGTTMTLKICHQWEAIEYIEATCPHCSMIDTYMFVGDVGDIVQCSDERCEKRFKLGEQE